MLSFIKAVLMLFNVMLFLNQLSKQLIGLFILTEIFDSEWNMLWIELLNGFGCRFTGIDSGGVSFSTHSQK
jgi:hypothetical protein